MDFSAYSFHRHLECRWCWKEQQADELNYTGYINATAIFFSKRRLPNAAFAPSAETDSNVVHIGPLFDHRSASRSGPFSRLGLDLDQRYLKFQSHIDTPHFNRAVSGR